MELRVPPNSETNEKQVLCGVLRKPDLLIEAGWLLPEHFYKTVHQKIWRVFLELQARELPIDDITVTDRITDVKFPVSELIDATTGGCNTAHFVTYAKTVYNLSVRRKMLNACYEGIEHAYDLDADIEDAIDGTERALISATRRENENDFRTIAEVTNECFDYLEAVSKRGADTVGLKTGFTDLDAILTGIQKGELTILAARPGMGKTAFAGNISVNIAVNNHAVAFFSLEMSNRQIGMRALASLAGVDGKRMKEGRLKDADWPRLTIASGKLAATNFHVIDTRCNRLSSMVSKIRWIVAKEKVELVVIDHLSLIDAEMRGASLNEKTGTVTRTLKLLSKELDIAILLLSQLSRECERRPNKRPILPDLRDSGSIEQDADVVLFIYRDEYYDEDSPKKGTAEIIAAKFRDGESGCAAVLAWDAPTTCFKNLCRHYEAREEEYKTMAGNND